MRPSRAPLTSLVLVLAGVALVATACLPAPVGDRGSIIAPTSGALFGIYEPPGYRTFEQQRQQLATAESDVGRRYDIVHAYYDWGGGFPTARETDWLSGGRTPLISWAGPVVSSITNGSQDTVIDARARALAALGQPVLLRWFWEMDGSRNASRALNPSAYKAAWRRIVSRFRNAGASKVEFVWCPTAYGFVTGAAQGWYPGDDVVDWTCADGYNWAPLKANTDWRTFAQIHQAFYDWAVQRPRPLIVGEFGAIEDPNWAGRKAQWLSEARTAVKTRFTRIKAVVYFDSDGVESGPYDWRIATSSSSKSAWRSWAQDSWFRTRG